MLPTKLSQMTTGLSVQEKKQKIDSQDSNHGGHLGFPIRMTLAILIHLSPECFLSRFKTIGLSFQGKKGKIDFQDGAMLDFQSKLFFISP